MAESKNNIITHGLSGMVGDLIVFRQRAGKTIVANAPKESIKEATAAQQAVRQRFQQAVVYGKAITADNTKKALYQAQAKEGETPFNVAVADFFNAPDISEIDVSSYHGQPGNTIKVKVTDDFAVQRVHVKIENPDASIVEEGDAVADGDGLHYLYAATKTNDITGDKITVTAFDIPDNMATREIIL